PTVELWLGHGDRGFESLWGRGARGRSGPSQQGRQFTELHQARESGGVQNAAAHSSRGANRFASGNYPRRTAGQSVGSFSRQPGAGRIAFGEPDGDRRDSESTPLRRNGHPQNRHE